jgi:hypothetical protein
MVPDRTRPLDFEDLPGHRRDRHSALKRGAGIPAVLCQLRPAQSSSQRVVLHRIVCRACCPISNDGSVRAPAILAAKFIWRWSMPTRRLIVATCGNWRSPTLCTNRDLPLHMPVGRGDTDFTLTSGAPVSVVRCLAGPDPAPPFPRPWRYRLAFDQPSESQLSVDH